MRSRKETAWRKNREFGEIHGGRTRRRFADDMFRRFHSLRCPAEDVELPIFIQDNPSRDFFFPLSVEDIREVLPQVPSAGLTHIWLRRLKKSDWETGKQPFASFIAGSGVRLVVLYPWPRDMLLRFGEKKPSRRRLRSLTRWGPELAQDSQGWLLRWNEAQLRKFYIEDLLLHEIGHHIDFYCRQWSKANVRTCEAFAYQFAVQWSAAGTITHCNDFEEGGNAEPFTAADQPGRFTPQA
jgi:hypothetical protein